jgi:hypothetical protein
MKVYDHHLRGTPTSGTARSAETSGVDRAENRSVNFPRGEGDRVELSNTLRELSRTLAAYGEQRTATVQSLAGQYQAGQYQADPAVTGRAIVADALAPADY